MISGKITHVTCWFQQDQKFVTRCTRSLPDLASSQRPSFTPSASAQPGWRESVRPFRSDAGAAPEEYVLPVYVARGPVITDRRYENPGH